MDIIKHFGMQFHHKPISEKLLSKLTGKSLYSNYKLGDIVLCFVEQCEDELTKSTNMKIVSIVKRELNILDKDYKFLREESTLPVFVKRKKVIGSHGTSGASEVRDWILNE